MSPRRRDAEAYLAEFTTAWNSHDVDRLLDACADDISYHDPLRRGTLVGKEQFRSVVEAWFSSFGEITYELNALVDSGNQIAVLAHLRGKNSGETRIHGRTIPATNRDVELDVAEFLRFDDDGKLARDDVVFDTNALFTQLGEPSPSATEPRA